MADEPGLGNTGYNGQPLKLKTPNLDANGRKSALRLDRYYAAHSQLLRPREPA